MYKQCTRGGGDISALFVTKASYNIATLRCTSGQCMRVRSHMDVQSVGNILGIAVSLSTMYKQCTRGEGDSSEVFVLILVHRKAI